jgi:hypothetical protein
MDRLDTKSKIPLEGTNKKEVDYLVTIILGSIPGGTLRRK